MLNAPEIDSVSAVRSYRENYVNLYALWTNVTGVPEGVDVKTPEEQPILDLDLSSALRDVMAEWEQSHPKTPLTPVKYMRVVDGKPVLVIEDDRPLPDENDLVSFSHTVTTTSTEAVSVVIEHLVATRNPDVGPIEGPGGPSPTQETTS